MEARRATVGNGVREREMVLAAEVVPKSLLVLGEHQDETNTWDGTLEGFEGVHQHGASAYRQKLLRQVSAHTQPLAASNNYAKGGPTPAPLPREGSSYL